MRLSRRLAIALLALFIVCNAGCIAAFVAAMFSPAIWYRYPGSVEQTCVPRSPFYTDAYPDLKIYGILIDTCFTTSVSEEKVLGWYGKPGWFRMDPMDKCPSSVKFYEIGRMALAIHTIACISSNGGITDVFLTRLISVNIYEAP